MVDIHQEAVHRDRDLAMGRLRTSQPFRWSTMKSRLFLEVLLMLLGLRRNRQIRTRCSVRLCRGRHHLHRLFLFLFLLILSFRFLKVLDRHRQGMCHRLVLVVSTQMIRPRRSRGLSWDRRWCCCLVSRLGRRIPLLRVTSRVSMNPLLRRLHRHRFLVCLSLREISLPRRKMVRIRIRTRPSTIVGIPCLPWLLATTMF